MGNSLEIGKWWVVCDRCGSYQKNDDVTETWDKLIVCRPEIKQGCFEHRHPQDFVRGVVDRQGVPFVRVEPTDVFTSPTYVSTGTQETTIPTGTSGNGTTR